MAVSWEGGGHAAGSWTCKLGSLLTGDNLSVGSVWSMNNTSTFARFSDATFWPVSTEANNTAVMM
jgi:hypothetical protein